jgi:hypothetical protein
LPATSPDEDRPRPPRDPLAPTDAPTGAPFTKRRLKMSAGKRWAVLGSVVVIAVVAFVIFQPGGGKKRATPVTATRAPAAPTVVDVVHGKPAGGVKAITVKKDQRVRFTVKSDVADEIHVHGYDFKRDVPKGGSASFDFAAKIDGGFAVELERRSEQIAELKVEP